MILRNELLTAFENLEEQRRALTVRLDGMNEELLAIKEGPGKWSINQVLVHLANAEAGSLRYMNKKLLGIDHLKVLNGWATFRSNLLSWILATPIKFKMPKQLPEPSNDYAYGQLIQQFDENRNGLRELIETIPEKAIDKLIFRHPFAGRFTLLQTVIFLQDHFNRHSRQIERILKVVASRGNN